MTAEVTRNPTFPDPSAEPKGEIYASTNQIAILNNRLPRGFRFEPYETARKFDPSISKSGKRKKTSTKRSDLLAGSEYEIALQNENIANKKIAQKVAGKRYSAREKKPVVVDDLGYVSKDLNKKNNKSASEGYKKCERVLALLKKHPSAGQFINLTVLPGYVQAVSEPMDLATLERKLKAGVFTSSSQFAADARKIWSNCWHINQPGTDAYIATTEMSNYFEKLMKEVGDVQFTTGEELELQDIRKNLNKATAAVKQIASSTAPRGSKSLLDKPMSTQEKAQLKQNIMQLSQEKLQGVIRIIQSAVDTSKSSETLEFDIDKLPVRVCRELDQYVKKSISTPKKSPNKKPLPKPQKTGRANNATDQGRAQPPTVSSTMYAPAYETLAQNMPKAPPVEEYKQSPSKPEKGEDSLSESESESLESSEDNANNAGLQGRNAGQQMPGGY